MKTSLRHHLSAVASCAQLSLQPEMDVLRQRVLGFEPRKDDEAADCGVSPLSEEEQNAIANASSEKQPVSSFSSLHWLCR